MSKSRLVLTIAAALLSLSGCRLGIFGLDIEHENYSLSGFTTIEGSDSIMGTWVGVTDYTASIAWHAEIEGSQLRILQINSDGVGGYQTHDCKGAVSEVDLNLDENSIVILERELQIENLNEISGSVTYEKQGPSSINNENWTWLKISNENTGLGHVNIDVISDQHSKYEQRVLAFCLHSYVYIEYEDDEQDLNDEVRVAWDEDSGTEESLLAVDRATYGEGIIVESEKRKFLSIPNIGISMSSKSAFANKSATVSFSNNNNFPQAYSANFKAEGPGINSENTLNTENTLVTVDLNLIIPK